MGGWAYGHYDYFLRRCLFSRSELLVQSVAIKISRDAGLARRALPGIESGTAVVQELINLPKAVKANIYYYQYLYN